MVGILEAKKKKELGIDEGEVIFHGDRLVGEKQMFGEDGYDNEGFQFMVNSTKIGRIVETTYKGKDLQFEDGIKTGDKVKLVVHDDFCASWVKNNQ